jgi:hypothetical protein
MPTPAALDGPDLFDLLLRLEVLSDASNDYDHGRKNEQQKKRLFVHNTPPLGVLTPLSA